ncbi:hypothetical protein [Spiroplasma endosymbiont of Villa modesta]|uniref:hypothetical protein n=1 Tax=Spiroplasma endosymbiont of Villa modesta TaxID=3066293 RepID=UPI00313EC024
MTRYSKELKLKIIEQYFAGKSATTLSKENKVSRKIIYIWFIAPNLLKQSDDSISFSVNKLLEKIALDISEFKINNQKLYLWAFVDFYSRKIVHHYWSKNQEKSHLIKSLKTCLINIICIIQSFILIAEYSLELMIIEIMLKKIIFN